MNNKNKWRLFGFVLGAIAVLSAAGIGGYMVNKPTKPGMPCGIPDTYGFHDYHDGQREVTCPDKRQKFTITRLGQNMGIYEYNCHCD